MNKYFITFLCMSMLAAVMSCQEKTGGTENEGPSIERIILNTNTLVIPVGYTETLTATVMPVEATGYVLEWSSSDPACATVSADGVITSVALGDCIITVGVEGSSIKSTCSVTVTDHYIDEYGIDQGAGIQIGTVIWAPVNCGYHETDYPYGKFYQWGRVDGFGYTNDEYNNDWDATGIERVDGPISYGDTPNPTVFYTGVFDINHGQWMELDESGDYAFDGTTKWDELRTLEQFKDNEGIGDPCPRGWRVPTFDELRSLKCNSASLLAGSTYVAYGPNGQPGRFFGENHALATADDPMGCIFLPLSGEITPDGGITQNRGRYGHYWASTPDPNEVVGWEGPTGVYGTMAQAIYLASYSGNGVLELSYQRAYGINVRCVKDTNLNK